MIYNLGEMNGKITYTGIKDEYKKYMVYGGEATLVNEGYEQVSYIVYVNGNQHIKR